MVLDERGLTAGTVAAGTEGAGTYDPDGPDGPRG